MLSGLMLCFSLRPAVWVLPLLLIPMTADGLIQLKTDYESTNPRRFVTGLLFGYGLMTLLIVSFIATYQLGHHLGQQLLYHTNS